MAGSLSNVLLKSIANLSGARSGRALSGQFYNYGMRYSTTVPNDPDSHEDFQPKDKLECSEVTVKDVEKDVKENSVVIYMKGTPEIPQCGFSSLAVRVLKNYSVPLCGRDISWSPELKNAVKAFSHWPTFPQIFIKGEFIGGSDILMTMHQNGELKEKLKGITSN